MRLTALLLTATCLALPALARMPTGAHSEGRPQGLTVVDWKQIRAEYERHRHAMFPDGSGYKARSFEQQWLARFDGRGVSVEPNDGAWRWGLELAGVTGKARIITDINRITYCWSADLDEWFLNGTRGLEHGFTLKTPREIRLAVRGGLQARPTGTGVEFVDVSGTARVKYTGLAAWDADGRSLPAQMTVAGGQVTLAVQDRGARYPIAIDPIAQQAYLKASNTENFDAFGLSAAVSGDTVVVGAHMEDSIATGVNGDQSDNSAPGSGAAYVFVRSGVTWAQQAYLKASNTGANDFFGLSVAVSGDTVVVGASGEDSNATGVNGNQADNNGTQSGAAYVFVRGGGTWTQQAYLKASNTGLTDAFGTFVAVDGDTAVVGAFAEDSDATGVNGNQADNSSTDSGAAYVFVRSGGWTQQAYLKASNTGANDNFGASVAVSGDTVVVGAYHEDSNAMGLNGDQSNNTSTDSGAAYVFVRNGGAWTQQAYLKASNTEQMGALASDLFGWSVAVSGDTVVVGAYQEDGGATGVNGNQFLKTLGNSGAAYVFVRSGSTWTQQAYLKASNTGMSDLFGFSVAISGDTVLVGAYGEASNATGVNGNQADNSATQTGAVYAFVRNGATWTQSAYLKASTSEGGDAFAYSVALSGDTAVIGARYEDSSAVGVNGDQSNNSAAESGAAYVFAGLAATTNVTIESSPTGLLFNSSGTGCAPGTGYVTPQTLSWTAGSSCSLTFGTPQTGPGSIQYNFHHWEDNSTNATRAITAPANPTSYTAVFVPASGAQPISVGPPSGTAGRQVFNFVARDALGANSIQYAQFLFSKSGLSALNACYISYDPAANAFYLLSDDMTQWYGLLGGSASTLGNAQCTIHGATSGSTKVGTDLTTSVDISFRSGFAGLKTIYEFSGDTLGAGSGWQAVGTWNDTGDPGAVELVSWSPNSGSGASQTFTAVTKDGDGANTISFTQLVINGALSGFNGCFIHYDRASNVFYLLNDAGTAFAGMFGGSGQVSNSQCTLHGAGSGGTVVGSNLTVTYVLDFSAGFAGAKKVFMQAVDNTNSIEVWHQMGTWTR